MNLYCVLAGWETVKVQGPDAKDYLQRMTTADFRPLAPGRFTPATLLNPMGKILLYFKALRRGPDEYLLVVPGTSKDAFEALEKMHFREDFKIEPQHDQWVYLRVLVSDKDKLAKLSAALAALREATNAAAGELRDAQGTIAFNEARWNRAPFTLDLGLLVPKAQLAEATAELERLGLTRAESAEPYRLRAADPGVPFELNSKVIPLEAQLDDAVHENKGCYPGQEVVERIRAMGQVPRILVQVRGQGSVLPAAETPVLAAETSAGAITSAAADPIEGGWVGLAYLRRTLAKTDAAYTAGGQAVRVVFPS